MGPGLGHRVEALRVVVVHDTDEPVSTRKWLSRMIKHRIFSQIVPNVGGRIVRVQLDSDRVDAEEEFSVDVTQDRVGASGRGIGQATGAAALSRVIGFNKSCWTVTSIYTADNQP